jgi:hypothetical protein
MDLLIKNQRADIADLKRQEKEMSALQVFERIPMEQKVHELHEQLILSAKQFGLLPSQFKVTHFSQPGKTIPKKVFTNEINFRITPDQLTEKIYFRIQVKGTNESIDKWIQNWSNHPVRIVELDSRQGGNIQAHAFRFRPIRFPTLVPRKPIEYLPKWAQTNLKYFSETEPLLWSFVTRIQNLAPQTPPYYMNRARFLLNDARYSFFLSKSLTP